ncbi:unnamed protein product [Microthlaspi erraticum]|uniref:F-box domain-containing protein n=1 Tax=Microthlaspi erraticum TaxID=1685480 RepID=A0A6D2IN34_9BRAS|nr:unnamed protein product [Microthlaspi erraticum]
MEAMKKKKKVTKRSKCGLDSLPVDLLMEIFKQFPVKTLTRFLSVSKLWASVIRNPDFMKLFLKESLNRPRGLVLIYRRDKDSTSRSKHPRFKAHESSASNASLTTYHVTCRARKDTFIATSSVHVLCVTKSASLGNTRGLASEIWVLTLGSGNSWKRIYQDNIPRHSPISQDLCINGVLYYRAFTGKELKNSAIVSFDVRSEKLHLIKAKKLDITKGPQMIYRNYSKLTCYEGKLAVVFFERDVISNMCLWVLKDAAKKKWSRKVFVLPTLSRHAYLDSSQRFHSTDTNTGEIIFSGSFKSDGVSYYDVKGNRVRRVDIAGKKCKCVCYESLSSGQVENLMFL